MNPEEAYMESFRAKKRLPEVEAILLKDASFSYLYANNIIKGRWEEAEATIATDAQITYNYVICIIKGRWEEGKAIIATFTVCIYMYARDVLKWKIKNNKDFYILAIRVLWNDLPEKLKNDLDIMTAYFKELILR
jgi:hypothetical protein